MKNAMNPCRKCERYYAIPPNVICEHCANGCKHQHFEKKIKAEGTAHKNHQEEATKVTIEISNKDINDAMDLITETIGMAKIGDHVAMVALTFILIQYEKKLGTKIEVK